MDGLTRTIKGDGLTLRGHAPGESASRGAAPDRSGSIRSRAEQDAAGDESSHHNSAHLIADRFRGTGQGKGRNLATTSATYNGDPSKANNSMLWAENELSEWIEGKPEGSEFSLEVSVEWGGLKEPKFIEAAVMAAMKQGESLDELAVETEVDRYLAAHPGTKLQRVLGVTYRATLDGDPKTVRIGPDLWLTR